MSLPALRVEFCSVVLSTVILPLVDAVRLFIGLEFAIAIWALLDPLFALK